MCCSFGVDIVSSPLTCVFYVFRKVATPLIMGMAFLEETKTMTEHRERLVRVARLPIQTLTVRSVGRHRKRMSCKIGGSSLWAVPDSGSDVNLLAPSIASALKLRIEPLKEVLQLADGTMVTASGFVRASVSLHSPLTTEYRSAVHLDFVLLECLAIP